MADEQGEAAQLLLLNVDGFQQMTTNFFGMDLVQEVARLLGSANIRSTKLGEELTLWHAEDGRGRSRSGKTNPGATRLAAEHGSPPVSGTAVLTGPMLYGTPYPLDAGDAQRIVTRLCE